MTNRYCTGNYIIGIVSKYDTIVSDNRYLCEVTVSSLLKLATHRARYYISFSSR